MINVLLQRIDGPGGILGQAGACFVRLSDGLPLYGVMFFDTDDLAFLEANSLLDEVIVHEMGHVLGFSGGIWNLNIPGHLPADAAGEPEHRRSAVPRQAWRGRSTARLGGRLPTDAGGGTPVRRRARATRTGTRTRSSTS